ncbi:hypothetical protein [Fibrobacter sp.]|uniref:hypothetical protein n=1 Tax=Fibrobacter sp. TaxID=35828 RepID=UPI00388F260D
MTHNREYVFNQDNIETVREFVNRFSDISRYEDVRLAIVKDRDGNIDHYEIDASLCTGEKWIVQNVDDCLHLVCSDAYILGMMVDYHYVIFKP